MSKALPNVVVFWTVQDDQDIPSHKFVAGELADGRLRQGWGVAGYGLTQSNMAVPKRTWIEGALKTARLAWPSDKHTVESITKRYNILKRMLDIHPGDLLLVPNMRSEGFFTMATSLTDYYFDLNHEHEIYGNRDYGHVIGLDLRRLVELADNSSPEAEYISSRFRHRRSAVVFVRDEEYATVARRLFANSLTVDDHASRVPEKTVSYPSENRLGEAEGAQRLRTHIEYERSPKNREAAIRLHGTKCNVCGFDYDEIYGPDLARSFIEVHHTRQLSTLGGMTVTPIIDLITICANCHRMAHRRPGDLVSLDELRQRAEWSKHRWPFREFKLKR